jgi:DNA-binding XRE family transcriptional regulator
MDLGITQKEVARRIGADQWTVINWEKGRTWPAVRFVPGILRFCPATPSLTR